MQGLPLVASDQPTKAETDGLGQKGSHLPGPARTGSSVIFGLGQDKLQWQVIGCSGHYLLVAVRSLLQVGLRTMTVRTLLLRYEMLNSVFPLNVGLGDVNKPLGCTFLLCTTRKEGWRC